MDDRYRRRIEDFKESMVILMQSGVERACVPNTDDQVYCRCRETTCRAMWIGSVGEWSCGFGFTSDNQHFIVRLCADHDSSERRAEIEAQQESSLGWRAEAWDRFWASLLSQR